MPNQRTSTLYATESALRPWVLAVTYGSCAAVALALGWTATRLPVLPWLVCAVPSLALEASNLHYLRTHAQPTVGMMPVALFSLITPCAACAMVPGLPSIARGALLAIVGALCAFLGLFLHWFWRLRRAYVAHPDIASDAALIVLGGAIKRGRPCETLALRLDAAARLWQQCPTRTIMPTGGPIPDGSTTEAAEMARYLRQCGVSPSSLLLEEQARNTHENVLLAGRLLDEQGFRGQRCVVSSDYHLWRALRDARALGASLTPVAAPTPWASVPQQWCREVLTILTGR